MRTRRSTSQTSNTSNGGRNTNNSQRQTTLHEYTSGVRTPLNNNPGVGIGATTTQRIHSAASSPSTPGTSANGSQPTTPNRRRSSVTPNSSPRKRIHFSVQTDSPSSAGGSGDEDSVHGNAGDDSIQPVAIHEILLDRIPLNSQDDQDDQQAESDACAAEGDFTLEEKIIRKVINDYNKSHPRTSTTDDDGDSDFKLEGDRQIIMPEEKKQHLKRGEFKVQLYVRETTSENDILKWNNSALRNKNYHVVWFFYRRREIFALTTNQGYNVVNNFSDYHFPSKIASRLCAEHGPTQTDDKVLVGHMTHNAKTTQIGKGHSTEDAPVLCTSYTAELRKNASILGLPCFASERQKHTRSLVQFGFSFVRFHKRFKVEDLPLVLDRLSSISRGCVTYPWIYYEEDEMGAPTNGGQSRRDEVGPGSSIDQTRPANEIDMSDSEELGRNRSDLYQFSQEAAFSPDTNTNPDEFSANLNPNIEQDAAVYRRTLAKVPPQLSKELDEKLAKSMVDGMNTLQIKDIGTVHFVYKKFPTDVTSLTLSLYYKSNENCLENCLPRHPHLKDILRLISPAIHNQTRASMVNSILRNFKVRSNNEKNKSNWFQFVEAELVHDERIFWRVKGLWCTVHTKYIFNAHHWFQKQFLQKKLLVPNPAGNEDGAVDGQNEILFRWPMPRPRQRPCTIQDYLQKYKGKDKFFDPPEKKKYLFDLMRFDEFEEEKVLELIYLSTDLTSQTTEICIRVSQCMEEMKLFLDKKNPSGYFYEFYKTDIKPKGYDEAGFKEILSQCHFIYGLCDIEAFSTEDNWFHQPDEELNRLNRLLRKNRRRLKTERDLLDKITQNSIYKILRDEDDLLDVDDIQRFLEAVGGLRQNYDVVQQMAHYIIQGLRKEGYLVNNSPTLKFMYTSIHNFSLNIRRKDGSIWEEANKYNKIFYALLSELQTQYCSTFAKLELKILLSAKFFKTKFFMYEIEVEEEE